MYIFTLPNLAIILLKTNSCLFMSRISKTSTSMSELFKFLFSKNK